MLYFVQNRIATEQLLGKNIVETWINHQNNLQQEHK